MPHGWKEGERPELKNLMDFLREGDQLVVTRVDRLGRSVRDLQNIVYELAEKGVSFRAIEQPIDTSTSMGKFFVDMLSVFSEFETNLRRERQAEGISAAKEKGIYKGRKPSINAVQVKEMKDQGMTPTQISKELGISRQSVYRVLN
jgi:DNA invertase Pin-like site-specific DNA recombinase